MLDLDFLKSFVKIRYSRCMNKILVSLFIGKTNRVLTFLDSCKSIMYFYAVARGRNPGIYDTWAECSQQVSKFSGARFKKFNSKKEAEAFIKENSGVPSNSYVKKSSNLNFLKKQLHSLSASNKRYMSSDISSDSDEPSNVCTKRQKTDYCEGETSSEKKTEFIVDGNGFVEVYTDGACSANGRGHAKAGIGVWFADNHHLNVSRPVEGRATNNMAEIQAVTVAARQASLAGVKKLKICTDSEFLIKCITQWMPKWKRNGWKTSGGQPVINKIELIEMENSLKNFKITWNHVRGHVGIHGNEMADKLAREGSLYYKN